MGGVPFWRVEQELGDGAVGEEGGQADAVVGEVGLFAEDEDGVGGDVVRGAEKVFEEFFAGGGLVQFFERGFTCILPGFVWKRGLLGCGGGLVLAGLVVQG